MQCQGNCGSYILLVCSQQLFFSFFFLLHSFNLPHFLLRLRSRRSSLREKRRSVNTLISQRSVLFFDTAIYCPPLRKPDNGELKPARRGERNRRKFNDTCSVTCSPGYEPENPAGQTTTCLENGSWNIPFVTGCKSKILRPVSSLYA